MEIGDEESRKSMPRRTGRHPVPELRESRVRVEPVSITNAPVFPPKAASTRRCPVAAVRTGTSAACAE
jgi:hypothetical protein